jgi:hypothetical protein
MKNLDLIEGSGSFLSIGSLLQKLCEKNSPTPDLIILSNPHL